MNKNMKKKSKIIKEERAENSFTLEDMRKSYTAGIQRGSRAGMRLINTGNLSCVPFDSWFSNYYKIEKESKLRLPRDPYPGGGARFALDVYTYIYTYIYAQNCIYIYI